MNINTKAAFRELTEKFEGRTNYMYQCVNGHVTIGLGCTLTEDQAAELFDKFRYGDPSSKYGPIQEMVRSQWRRVAALPEGWRAEEYADYTGIRLKDDAIEQLFQRRRDAQIKYLRNIIDWDDLPEDAQLGVLLNTWAKGCGLNLRESKGGQPAFLDALETGDFGRCALIAQISNNPTGRNEAIRRCFENASDAEVMGNVTRLYYPGRVAAEQRTLRLDDKGSDVANLKKYLHYGASDYSEELFDERFERVLRPLQASHGLNGDGIVGPKTRKALGWRV